MGEIEYEQNKTKKRLKAAGETVLEGCYIIN